MKRLILAILALSLLLMGCGKAEPAASLPEPTGTMELQYAEHFSVDYYDDAALLTIGDGDRYVLLEKDANLPKWAESIPVIRYPVEQVYLASSSVADLFVQLGALDCVSYTSTQRSDWYLPEVQSALADGTMQYVGKYRAPDYELLLDSGCDLVVENTMIFHNPEVKEKLEALGLPVFVEYSSYEPHPLGRVEWIKLYGLLTGHLKEAEDFFDEQVQILDSLSDAEPTGKTVAFFHITTNGSVVVRRSQDYVTQMIRLAGGETAFTDLPEEDNALSTVTIQMESFYTQAKDADILIYNSTVAGDLPDIDALLQKSELFRDFKAVQTGNVWCTEQSMFQQSSATAGMIRDFHEILTGGDGPLRYLHRVI